MTISFEDFKAKALADSAVKAAYDARAAEFDLANELISARTRAGLSQAQLAERMGVAQSAVARIESGRHWPSRATLERYAAATGSHLRVSLDPAE